MARMESYVTECLIKAREGEPYLFQLNANSEVLARLQGYAIIPIEEYENLRHVEQSVKRIGIKISETPDGVRWQFS